MTIKNENIETELKTDRMRMIKVPRGPAWICALLVSLLMWAAIIAIGMVLTGCTVRNDYLPSTVPHNAYLYGPLVRTEMYQRRDLALYCNERKATYTLDSEACAFTRGNSCHIVYLHREGIGGEHEKQLIAICNGWHPRMFAQ